MWSDLFEVKFDGMRKEERKGRRRRKSFTADRNP